MQKILLLCQWIICQNLRSDLRDFNDAYIVVKGRISVTGNNTGNRRNKKLTFKNNAPFNLDHVYKKLMTLIGNSENIVVMPMDTLLEYSNKIL